MINMSTLPTYPIKGIPLPTSGALPERREIDSWWNDPECFAQHSLFFRALAAFKELNPVDPTDGKLSYFQVAGDSLLDLVILLVAHHY